jgi:hypothetical protein
MCVTQVHSAHRKEELPGKLHQLVGRGRRYGLAMAFPEASSGILEALLRELAADRALALQGAVRAALDPLATFNPGKG